MFMFKKRSFKRWIWSSTLTNHLIVFRRLAPASEPTRSGGSKTKQEPGGQAVFGNINYKPNPKLDILSHIQTKKYRNMLKIRDVQGSFGEPSQPNHQQYWFLSGTSLPTLCNQYRGWCSDLQRLPIREQWITTYSNTTVIFLFIVFAPVTVWCYLKKNISTKFNFQVYLFTDCSIYIYTNIPYTTLLGLLGHSQRLDDSIQGRITWSLLSGQHNTAVLVHEVFT